ncbi:MAG: UDP-3-O-(3-hydroxymyristoyl)glucosamine N-acyltransferase [Proteobacteria bacterium]|nr:UDP-3-O-(3-hydroxymyristoyl)glucosamine N-acyltransferase [Pseudomonadota bacterium]
MEEVPDSKSFRLRDIVELFGGDIIGDAGTMVTQVASIKSAKSGNLIFFGDKRLRKELLNTKASAVILSHDDSSLTNLPKIVTTNPYAYFAQVSRFINPPDKMPCGVSKYAVVSETAKIAHNSSIGPNVVISDHAHIHSNANVEAGCYIGKKATIGEGVKMYPNVTIADGCIIGANTVIQAGAVIGGDGFGLARSGKSWIKIPQLGRVIIGDNCEIGANTTIDRGALDDTIIKSGVKLDNQIQIGHNCYVGENTAIAACVGIAGSTVIGDNCRIGGGARISGHLEIANDIIISGGTFIYKSLKKPGRYTGVYPTNPHEEWKRNASLVRSLRKLVGKLKKN